MEALQELHIPGCRNEDAPSAHAESSISAIKLFGTLEIYPGTFSPPSRSRIRF